MVAIEMNESEKFLMLLVGSNIITALLVCAACLPRQKEQVEPVHEVLHFDPQIQRRGLGDLVRKVNHVAFIVTDVGRSLAFYTEVIGFQQIQRPNFDRHGAWLTMGNTELHLIKGVPNAPSGKDLIVSHMALETDHPEQVLEKLVEMEIPFRQNISVPDPKKARDNLVECFENSDGKITQYFIRDPDGYYLELCDCDKLTRFCLFKEDQDAKSTMPAYLKLMTAAMSTYNESGQRAEHALRCPLLFKIGVVLAKRLSSIRKTLRTSYDERLAKALAEVIPAKSPDQKILSNMLNRQKTYCDATQGFSRNELIKALCAAGNSAPIALLILGSKRIHNKIWMPPQYLLSEGGIIEQQVFKIEARHSPKKLGTRSMFRGRPFLDNMREVHKTGK